MDMPPPNVEQPTKSGVSTAVVLVLVVAAGLVGYATGSVELRQLEDDLEAARAQVEQLQAREETPADDEPTDEPPAEPVVIEGFDGNTEPFTLPAGRMTVTITTMGDCVFSIDLNGMDGREAHRLPSVSGDDTASGELYDVEAGEYFLEAITGPSCSYTVTFDPA